MAFGRSGSLKWLYIIHLESCRNQNSPIDSSDESEIHEQCKSLVRTTLPKSAFGQALGYTLNQWEKLRRIFDHGEVELSNNLAENSMRPVALGRKNWLHVGSKDAGPKVAAILSVLESCRRLGVSAKNYLLAVLPGMNARKVSEVVNLTPYRWSLSRP